VADGSIATVKAREAVSAGAGGTDSLADAGAAYAAAQAAADAKRAAEKGAEKDAMELIVTGILFAQMGEMRKTVAEASNKSKQRLVEMQELDGELEQ
jgi:hypothetical protein